MDTYMDICSVINVLVEFVGMAGKRAIVEDALNS